MTVELSLNEKIYKHTHFQGVRYSSHNTTKMSYGNNITKDNRRIYTRPGMCKLCPGNTCGHFSGRLTPEHKEFVFVVVSLYFIMLLGIISIR